MIELVLVSYEFDRHIESLTRSFQVKPSIDPETCRLLENFNSEGNVFSCTIPMKNSSNYMEFYISEDLFKSIIGAYTKCKLIKTEKC